MLVVVSEWTFVMLMFSPIPGNPLTNSEYPESADEDMMLNGITIPPLNKPSLRLPDMSWWNALNPSTAQKALLIFSVTGRSSLQSLRASNMSLLAITYLSGNVPNCP